MIKCTFCLQSPTKRSRSVRGFDAGMIYLSEEFYFGGVRTSAIQKKEQVRVIVERLSSIAGEILVVFANETT